MMVTYDADRNILCVHGIATPFPAGSLAVVRDGDMLAVASPHESSLICRLTDYAAWQKGDGTAFASADEAFAYLDEVCRRKRPVGLTPLPFTAGEPIGGHKAVRIVAGGLMRLASSD